VESDASNVLFVMGVPLTILVVVALVWLQYRLINAVLRTADATEKACRLLEDQRALLEKVVGPESQA
jgi:hypothetical protein